MLVPGDHRIDQFIHAPSTDIRIIENEAQARRHPCLDDLAQFALQETGERKTLSYRELHHATARIVTHLCRLGVKPGDRVAGYLPNLPETIIAMLGAASVGAIWSSCSPDFGVRAVLDRFGQLEPRNIDCRVDAG